MLRFFSITASKSYADVNYYTCVKNSRMKYIGAIPTLVSVGIVMQSLAPGYYCIPLNLKNILSFESSSTPSEEAAYNL